MRIEYENKFSDIVLFHAVHQFLSPALQGMFIMVFAFLFWSSSIDNSIPFGAFSTFCLYIGFWVLQFVFNAIYLYSRKNQTVLTTHVVEVLDEAFLEQTKFNKPFFYWNGIIKAVSRPGFVAVYVTPHLAHIVPNRAFSSKEQRARFLALVVGKIRAQRKQ